MTFKELELKIAAGIATDADFREFARGDVERIKGSLPLQCRGLVHAAEVEAALAPLAATIGKAGDAVEAASRAERTRTLIFNVQLGDRMGDVILANPADAKKHGGTGYETQHWEAAGAPYLWCHDPYDGGVVGRVSNPRVEKVRATLADGSKVKVWGFVGEVEFLADQNLEHAAESWAMVQAGFTASSIGFIPKIMVHVEDEDERTALGLGRWGVLFAQVEILEVSHVLIPANPWSIEVDRANARTVEGVLAKMVGAGGLSAERAGRIMARAARPAAPAWMAVTERVKAAAVGHPCEGLECLAGGEAERTGTKRNAGTEAERSAPHDCGCGAKTAKEQLAAYEAERMAIVAALPADVEGSIVGPDSAVVRAVRAMRADLVKEAALPEIRNALAVRRAMDHGCELVELLGQALEGDEVDSIDEGIVSEVAAATFERDLQAVRADATLTRAIEPLVRLLAAKASAPRPAAPAAPRPAAADADRALARQLEQTAADLRASRAPAST